MTNPTESERRDVVDRIVRAEVMLDRTKGMPAHIEWMQVVADLEAEMRKWPSRRPRK